MYVCLYVFTLSCVCLYVDGWVLHFLLLLGSEKLYDSKKRKKKKEEPGLPGQVVSFSRAESVLLKLSFMRISVVWSL